MRRGAVAELPQLRRREPAGGQVLHRVWHGARGRRVGRGGALTAGGAGATLSARGGGPSAAPPRPARGAVRRPAPRRRGAGLGLARRGRAAGGAPQGNGAVRRPVRLHGGRRAHGPRGREVDRGPGAATPRAGGRPLWRQGGQVHRRQRDGGLRRPGLPRGRPGARSARRPGDAGRDGGDQPGHGGGRRGGGRRQLLVAGRDQLRRGAGRSGRRRLHGDGRRGQRRRPVAGGGESGKRDRRRDHPPPDPGRDRVLRARASDPEGKGRARRGLGGRPRPGSWPGHPRRPQRGAPDRPRGRVGAAHVAVRPRGPREPPASGHRDRPGRGGQVAPAARAGGADERADGETGLPGRALPRLWRGARLLGARRDPARPVRAGRHRRLRRGLGEAPKGGRVGRLRRRDRRAAGTNRRDDRSPAGHRAPGRARDANRCPRRGRRAADPRPVVLRGALPGGGGEPGTPGGDRARGHPLGRRGHARPDRVPGAVGARARR